ncbi:AP2-containing protein [Hordeum vulgare]|nr:AP2-containing protein [Hordeum vulgare]
MTEGLMPQGIQMEEMPAKKRPAVVVSPGERDEAAMARFVQEHPQCVQAELEHYRKRDVEAKNKVVKEDKDNPSTVINIESPDEDWGDSKEEDGGCDDPTKDEFSEQFHSSDEEE